MLRERAETLTVDIKELMGELIVQSLTLSSFKNLDANELKYIQKSVKIFEETLEFTNEAAKQMDEINDKVDKILKKLEKQENRPA